MNNGSRLADERVFADLFASNTLTPDALQRWNKCRSTHRFQAFLNKELVAYTIIGGVPDVLNTFKCVSVDADFKRGLSSVWESSNNTVVVIGHAPVEIANGCFLWHSKYSNLEYEEFHGRFNLKVNLIYRTELNPITKARGIAFLLEKSTYLDYNFGG